MVRESMGIVLAQAEPVELRIGEILGVEYVSLAYFEGAGIEELEIHGS